MALKVVHYALICLAVALCLAVLYWRWRRVNNQNKALEAELRLIQPYNNLAADIAPSCPIPEREVVQMSPAVAAAEPVKKVVEQPKAVKTPPVLTPPALATIDDGDEDDEDDEPIAGAPPMVESSSSEIKVKQEPVSPPLSNDPMFVDFVSVMSLMPPNILNQTLEGSNIVELPDETKAEEPEPQEPVEIKDKPAPKTTRRRRN